MPFPPPPPPLFGESPCVRDLDLQKCVPKHLEVAGEEEEKKGPFVPKIVSRLLLLISETVAAADDDRTDPPKNPISLFLHLNDAGLRKLFVHLFVRVNDLYFLGMHVVVTVSLVRAHKKRTFLIQKRIFASARRCQNQSPAVAKTFKVASSIKM